MGDYLNGEKFIDSAMVDASDLVDYNTLSDNNTYPIPQLNDEVILNAYLSTYQSLYDANLMVDTGLVEMYDDDDLRKTLFYQRNNDGSYMFKGNYTGDYGKFAGLAMDELYLDKAEILARKGNASLALQYLNHLLALRYKNGTYQVLTSDNTKDLLQKVLEERRKELVFRGQRWMDLRRLNQEGYNIALARVIDNISYSLPAQDLRYALAIPEDIISLSGIGQNPR